MTLEGVNPVVFNADKTGRQAAFAQSIMDSTGGLFEEIIDIEAAGRRRLDDGAAGVVISYTGIARIDGTDNGEQVSADLLEQSMDALTLAIDDGSFLTTLQAADSAFAAVTVDETATRAAIEAATHTFVVTTPGPTTPPTAAPSTAPSARPTEEKNDRRGIGLALTVVVCVVASFVVIFVVSGCFGRHIVAAAPEPGTEKPPTPGNQANKLREVHGEMARWYQAPQQAALHQTFGPFPPPDRFEAWPGFVPVTNAFMDAEDRTASTERVPSAPPLPQEPPAEEEGWAARGLRRVMSWRATVRDMMLEQD